MDDFASFRGPSSQWKEEAEKVASQYDGKNEVQLTRDIYARAAEGKRNGTLTNEQIDAFYAQFAPMLDGAKRKRLKQLVERLKSL